MDWLFEVDNNICDMRAAGILIKNNKILVQRDKNGSEYAIPGGHVKIGETTEDALIREYKEETDADIKCERLLWTENINIYPRFLKKEIHKIEECPKHFISKE